MPHGCSPISRGQFGNLGLAAASYNAGAARVGKWLQSAGGLPLETRLYVRAVTGRAVEDWVGADGRDAAVTQTPSCVALIAELERRGRHAVPRETIWQVRLDGGLASAIALLASIPPARQPMPVKQSAPPAPRPYATASARSALPARCTSGRVDGLDANISDPRHPA